MFPKAFKWKKLNFSDVFVPFDMGMQSDLTLLKF